MNRYEAVHFFLDESGNLAGALRTRAPECLLVGRVLLFGGYGQAANNQLRQILVQRLTEVGGEFPEDLHFSRSRLAHQQKEAFLRAVDAELREWAGSKRAIYDDGASVHHALPAV